MDARGEIYWSPTGNPRRKLYLDESKGVAVQDVWWEFRDAHNQMVRVSGYPTEKNPALLDRIIRASSNEGDLVLDCFAGSGTTLVVADQLRRQWVGVDNSPEAIRTMLQRFAHGRERMGDFVASEAKALTPRTAPALSLFDPVPEAQAVGLKTPTASTSASYEHLINDFMLFHEPKVLLPVTE